MKAATLIAGVLLATPVLAAEQLTEAQLDAITAGAFVPLNFAAVRMAESLVHPRVFATAEGGMPGEMWLTFAVSMAGIAMLWVTLVRFELAAKSASARLGRLRRALEGETAQAPASRVAPTLPTEAPSV